MASRRVDCPMDDELYALLRRAAKARGCSLAEIMRQGVRRMALEVAKEATGIDRARARLEDPSPQAA